ncbi:MAG: hypothetical protein CL936_16195 [Deltaproteobacteria bacterium]|nr:hypothetical protein [Deltaproteobacteria bacterium]
MIILLILPVEHIDTQCSIQPCGGVQYLTVSARRGTKVHILRLQAEHFTLLLTSSTAAIYWDILTIYSRYHWPGIFQSMLALLGSTSVGVFMRLILSEL